MDLSPEHESSVAGGNSPTVSVALAAYQGERWLRAQLSSVLGQTRPVDQIVVSDDNSTDGTVEAARQMLQDSGCAALVLTHADRLGVSRNLERAIAHVSGDIVFLCDQDDVWEADRVERVLPRFTEPELSGVFCDGTIIDEAGNPTGRTLWEAAGFTPRRRTRWARRDGFADLLRGNVVTGAALAVRGPALLSTLPFPEVGWHDYWIALWLAAVSHLQPSTDRLVRYRLHDSNTAGFAAGSFRGQVAQRLEDPEVRNREYLFFSALQQRLREQVLDDDVRRALANKVAHQRHRASLPPSPPLRAVRVAGELVSGRYRRFSRGTLSAAFDLVRGS